MAKKKGTVTGCGKGKFSYFITLDSADGFYFNTKYEPKCGKGDVVGIEYEQKGSNRGNVKKVTVLEKNSNGYEDTTKQSGGGSGGKGGYTADPSRQESIVWQSSRKDAIELVTLLVQSEAMKLPKAPDARRVVIEGIVDEITVRYFADASDPKASKAFTTNAGVAEDAEEAPAPEGDEWDDSESEGEGWDDSKDEWDD